MSKDADIYTEMYRNANGVITLEYSGKTDRVTIKIDSGFMHGEYTPSEDEVKKLKWFMRNVP